MLPAHPLHEFDALISPEFQPVTELAATIIYYFTLTDGTIGLYLGDVSGKGLPAALYAAWRSAPCAEFIKPVSAPGGFFLCSTSDCISAEFRANTSRSNRRSFFRPLAR
jgi:hypothetical protein